MDQDLQPRDEASITDDCCASSSSLDHNDFDCQASSVHSAKRVPSDYSVHEVDSDANRWCFFLVFMT